MVKLDSVIIYDNAFVESKLGVNYFGLTVKFKKG